MIDLYMRQLYVSAAFVTSFIHSGVISHIFRTLLFNVHFYSKNNLNININ